MKKYFISLLLFATLPAQAQYQFVPPVNIYDPQQQQQYQMQQQQLQYQRQQLELQRQQEQREKDYQFRQMMQNQGRYNRGQW